MGARFANVAGALLLGGAAERMGRDKALLMQGGLPAATRAARLLARLFEEVLLVGGSPPASAPGTRVADVSGPACPLRGMVAALEASSAPRVLVLATDLPLVTADLLLSLVASRDADVVVPEDGDGLHPLCALYRRDAALPVARARLEQGDLALRDLVGALGCVRFDESALRAVDPGGVALVNVNTPADLARAERLLRGERGAEESRGDGG